MNEKIKKDLIQFCIWIDKKEEIIENGRITEIVERYLEECYE